MVGSPGAFQVPIATFRQAVILPRGRYCTLRPNTVTSSSGPSQPHLEARLFDRNRLRQLAPVEPFEEAGHQQPQGVEARGAVRLGAEPIEVLAVSGQQPAVLIEQLAQQEP